MPSNLINKREKEINNKLVTKNKIYKVDKLSSKLHPGLIKVEIKEIIRESDNVKSFILKRPNNHKLPIFKAGSYISLKLLIDNKLYQRPYSISSSPKNDGYYRITVKKELDGIVSSYLFDKAKVGTKLVISEPLGNFNYNSIRDKKNIILIAGGLGIAPLLSIIYETITLNKVKSISLIYQAKCYKDLVLKKEIDTLQKVYPKFKCIYILSRELKDGYLSGHITKELISSLNPKDKTFFICGPTRMYKDLNKMLIELDIPNKDIRHDIYKTIPTNLTDKVYKVTIHQKGKIMNIEVPGNKTLSETFEFLGILSNTGCKVGTCGMCTTKLIKGRVKTSRENLRLAEKEFNYIHPCVTYPSSNIEIEIP